MHSFSAKLPMQTKYLRRRFADVNRVLKMIKMSPLPRCVQRSRERCNKFELRHN